MLFALLTVIVMRIKVEWRIVFWASLGGLLGVYSGSVFLAPLFSADLLKMLFTALISSFALHLLFIGGFTETVQMFWLSAIPVVVVGAPLGTYVYTDE